MDLDEKPAALRSTSCGGIWQRNHARALAITATIIAALAMTVDPISDKAGDKMKEKAIVTRASHVVTHRTTGRA
jgi:hypothetical protein